MMVVISVIVLIYFAMSVSMFTAEWSKSLTYRAKL